MSDLEQALAYFGAHFDGAAKTNRMGMVLQDEVLRLRAECKETRQERDAYCDELHKVRAELAQYATGRTMSCASCNEVVKELAQVEAESQVIIDRYNSCKAELAALKDGGKRLLTKLCNESRRAEKAESIASGFQADLAALHVKLDKANADLAAAKAELQAMTALRVGWRKAAHFHSAQAKAYGEALDERGAGR